MSHSHTFAPYKARELSKFGHQRLRLSPAANVTAPVDEQAAALLALTAEATFFATHGRIIAKQSDLRGLASEYFTGFFDQIAAGKNPERDTLLEQCIIDSCGGTRAGDYFIQDMHRVANDLLMRQQKTGHFYVGGR